MANVLIGATGSVAAVRVPALFDALTAAGHTVKIVATDAATYFFDTAPFRGLGSRPSPLAGEGGGASPPGEGGAGLR
ncbi:flavoprotein [Frigoriglobus tundricola]|uniref:Phosphopantothenoylcysteine decarboxylase n=1 Tax=Frigoriglobus tundricola TaxID=2774151 RepID=A0A6M5YJ76_9BACT|nr:flavoprotein [Frigoriglobus tundricola]QJW93390.1 Phosphopantothenoylcysteine decarboxylase [Frigoriglobus tundricola]